MDAVLQSLGASAAQELETDQANKKIWLIKVPNFLAQRWKGACDHAMNEGVDPVGPKLGTIRYSKNATDSSGKVQTCFSLRLDGEATWDVPQEYSMAVTSSSLGGMSLVAFSEGAGRVAAEGKVDQKFDVEVQRHTATAAANGPVVIDPKYRQLSRQRHQAAATKTRTVQLISETSMARQRGIVASVGIKRKADQAEKRVARDKNELQRDLFRLFERQPHWAFPQLQKHTDQPTMHLKTVLSEIAVMAKNGPYKGQWELKKEYRAGGQALPEEGQQ